MCVLKISAYSDPPRIRNLGLRVDSGELVLVQGNAGTGKSKLAQSIAGITRVGRGRITIGDMSSRLPAARARSTFVFQFPCYDRARPALPQVVRRLMLYGDSMSSALDRATAWARSWDVPVLARQAPEHLTASQARLLDLALGLMRPWHLIVLDEPLLGLDPEASNRVLGFLADASAQSAVLCLSQKSSSLSDIADRAYLITEGLLVATEAQ